MWQALTMHLEDHKSATHTSWTLKAASNPSQGTVSQFGYAFKAASSLYDPGTPYGLKYIY